MKRHPVNTKPEYWYHQSAAAPVRTAKGKTEVLLVTSLRSGRWILPKGILEPGKTPQETAVVEAWEEAGVQGTLAPHRLGFFTNKKWGGVCTVEVFRLDVTQSSDIWPESDKRKRQWFALEHAVNVVHPDGAALVLKKIDMSCLILTLVRHAKSSHDDTTLQDFDRPLTERGIQDAHWMGAELRRSIAQPDSIVSSPACRAKETAVIIADFLDFPRNNIDAIPLIYNATSKELLELIKNLPEDNRNVLLVGHNPWLTDLAVYFLGSAIEHLPTCGIVQLAFNVQHWKDVSPSQASLLLYEYPKKIKA